MTEAAPVHLVTGAAGNVGRACLAALAAQGARLVACDREEAALRAVLAPLPGAGEHLALAGTDLLDPAACVRAVEQAQGRFGRLDGVAHTVGGFAMADAAGSDPAHWEAMFRINILTTLNIFRAALPAMRAAGGGSLVAVSAGAALRAPAGMAAYAASKAGVLRLVESFAEEVKREGVRVNAVMPGTLDTPQNRAAMPEADPAFWVQPSQVAGTIAFLLSPAASGITGAAVPVPGRG